MRTLLRFRHYAALPLLLLCCACAAQTPPALPENAAAAQEAVPTAPAAPIVPAVPAAQQAQAAQAPAPVMAEQAAALLNRMVNDSLPGSPEWEALRAELSAVKDDARLPAALRRVVGLALAYQPPRLTERWEEHQKALDEAASLYAEHPPVDTRALRGARVLRRLGPALYVVRLPNGDTGFFSTLRRLKPGARLDAVPVAERPRPAPQPGDLADDTAESGGPARTFQAITQQEEQRLARERAPVVARLKQLEGGNEAFRKDVAADLARLDALAAEVDAVVAPRLLGLRSRPPAARAVRQVKRMSHAYSPVQHYRYALPVTGKKQVDAVLKGYLEQRKRDVADLLQSVGVGAGRARANTDLAAFKSFRASEALFSVRFETLRDTGGAHPNQGFAAFTFDLRSQAVLGLEDLFSDPPAALQVLADLAKRRLGLALDGRVFSEGLEPRAENFAVFVLDGTNLVFTFPPYQTASHADGPQTLRVPLCHPRLAPLLSKRLLDALGAAPPPGQS